MNEGYLQFLRVLFVETGYQAHFEIMRCEITDTEGSISASWNWLSFGILLRPGSIQNAVQRDL